MFSLFIYLVGASMTTAGLFIMNQPFYAGFVLFVSGMILLISGLYTATAFVQEERMQLAETRGDNSPATNFRG